MSASVTAIVPTYNRPALLGASIESALSQTHKDLVVLVGDNGGSPLTEGIVRSFDDDRVRYVRHPEALGAQKNWLALAAMADTPFVASLHDDDTWAPTFLEKTVPLLVDDPSVSVAFSDFWCVDDHGDRLVEHTDWLTGHSGRDRLPPGPYEGSYADGLRMVALECAPQTAYASVLRRQAILDTEFPDEISPIYDLWLAYQVFRRGEGFAYVPERLTNYRVWGGSLTARGYGFGQDAVFAQIVEDNPRVMPVVLEIQEEWAKNRFDRARNALGEQSERVAAQRDFRLASPFLSGREYLVAELAGRSRLGWEAIRAARAGVRAVRARGPQALTAGRGLREDLVRPSSDAKELAS